MSDHVDTDHVPTDDWTVAKLLVVGFLVLGAAFTFIYSVSPYGGLGTPATPAIK
jgi:hypothetical protein